MIKLWNFSRKKAEQVNIVLLGPPGAGKGTQAKLIQEEFGYVQLSTGDLLRYAVAARSEVGRKAKSIMDRGELVPDDLVIRIISERIDDPNYKAGFILDGFPRTATQAEALDGLLSEKGLKLNIIIAMNADDDTLIERVTGRYICAECGENYHTKYKLPKAENICDDCGKSQFKKRTDDTEETSHDRLESYHEQTEPLIAYYSDKGILTNVDASASINDVYRDIRGILQNLQAQKSD